VSISNKNPLLAVYLISGRILTHCHSISLLLKNGFFAEAGIMIRSTYESVWVALHFYMNPSDTSQLEEWYRDQVISPQKARKGQSKLAKIAGSSKEEEKQFIKLLNKLYESLSKYTHPTYSISKINMNHEDNHYDYECKLIKDTYLDLPYSFEAVLVHVLNMFCLMSEMFEIDKTTYDKLREYVKNLENQ
jgi:hypothetical protein